MSARSKLEPICKVCEQDLYDDELDFYPCNCKFQICYECYNIQLERKDQKCPNCLKYYELHRVNEYIKKSSSRQVKNISSTQETYSSSNMSSYSMKHGSQNNQSAVKQLQQYSNKSPSQNNKRTSSDNNRQQHQQQTVSNPISKLSSIRILQKHILYVIGISPSIAKEETLRRYEYFGQYGRIQQITINRENAYNSENQGICFSAYITYSQPQEASIAILAVDQFVYDSRHIRASFGRTKYCKFFLKDTQCPKKECPYQHTICDQNEALTQDDMQKRQLFQQCQTLAFSLSKVCQITEDQFRLSIKQFKDTYYPGQQLKSIMPAPESIYAKKALFKQYAQYVKLAQSQQQQQQLTQKYNAPNSSRSVNIRQPSCSQQDQQQVLAQSSNINIEGNSDKIQSSQQIYKSSMSTSSQSFQIKNRNQITQSDNAQTNLASEEIKVDDTQKNQASDVISINKDDLTQKQPKRNNSTDELRNNRDQTYQNTMKNFEMQIVLSLTKQLQSEQDSKNQNSQINEETSIFNEKRTSRFLNMRDSSDEEDRIPQRENIILSRRSSLGQGYKKGSMQSLIVESLKFLIDDTDVVPNKREPLIQKNQFDTHPPSEVFNIATPAQSNLGGYNDEDILWNNTIFSQNEYNHNTRNMNNLDDKSYYSHQGFNNHQQRFSHTIKDNGGNSLFANSFLNQNFQPMRSQVFNDSNFQNSFSAHKPQYGQSFFGNIGVGPFGPFNQGNQNFAGRKTTLAPEQIESQIVGESKSLQLNRSPSQPNYEKLCLSQQANSRNLNVNQFNQIQISQFNTQQMFAGEANMQQQFKKSLPIQASASVQGININNVSNKQYQLNKQNLDLLDKHYETSKDLMYAKIFCQDGAASMNNNFISSQSLFYYNSQLDDGYEGPDMSNKRFSKLSERGQIPRTPVKDSRGLFRLTDDDDFYHDDSQFDQITKNSEPKNYYKEFLSLKDSSIFSGNLFSKRRNSLEQDREKLHPQSLQFNNTLSPFINDSQTDNGGLGVPGQIKKKSKSRSRQRKTTAMTATFEGKE
ncbi:ccr4-not transcription complex subunit 4 isoform 3 [Stylonychia lemnae]|uniref:Ccr4-not transcription complex subunit 4 isoform 3 n=1 Tax=Stylonychia lemnae TaxID=5949 RepID=A0A078AD64_STYLE|nr:ccr4-not transcription complex subunit 4 isoform 3 [Stylonychia lemnae]|eukprot:CDW78808.1 ccr4-not transcription complex subunit 4 isoform 3 [Stylonychia lemnae]